MSEPDYKSLYESTRAALQKAEEALAVEQRRVGKIFMEREDAKERLAQVEGVARELLAALGPTTLHEIITRMKIGYLDGGYFDLDVRRLYALADAMKRATALLGDPPAYCTHNDGVEVLGDLGYVCITCRRILSSVDGEPAAQCDAFDDKACECKSPSECRALPESARESTGEGATDSTQPKAQSDPA